MVKLYLSKKPSVDFIHLGIKWLYISAQAGDLKSQEALDVALNQDIPNELIEKGIAEGKSWLAITSQEKP